MLVTPLEDGSFCFAIIILYIANLNNPYCKLELSLKREDAERRAFQIQNGRMLKERRAEANILFLDPVRCCCLYWP